MDAPITATAHTHMGTPPTGYNQEWATHTVHWHSFVNLSMNTKVVVFVYTGRLGGDDILQDVVRLCVDPSVTSIPDRAFIGCNKLTEVELCEGVVEIGEYSFYWCGHSITKINIPSSLRRIKDWAFSNSLRTPIRLHDGIESIEIGAFKGCIFTNFRVPPLITVIPCSMLSGCKSTFSLQLSEHLSEIRNKALTSCCCLRNVAFPPNAVIGDYIFIDKDDDEMTDLRRLFDSNARIVWELQHRFDELPIHKLVYYQSYYHQGVLQNVIAAMNMRSIQSRTLRRKLEPTGNQQDCLGMTPLHILACSSVHDLELYRVIVDNYPTNLITEDRWGALPLLYAFWGAAPAEIIDLLLESYQTLYPGHVFNWTIMVTTMGRCDTPKESIENLLCAKQSHFPEQPLDWEYLLNKLAIPSNCHLREVLFQKQMRFLVMCGMSERVEALAFKIWSDNIRHLIQTADYKLSRDNSDILNRTGDNLVILRSTRIKLAHFEAELPKLKEATTILELALWKVRMAVNNNIHQGRTNCRQKKVRVDESSTRQHCRVTCGANVVIGHVLPFLL
jgi:hypothetical protein